MKLPKPKRGDAYKALIENILRYLGHEWQKEYRFHKTRLWRFDYAMPSLKIAIEYQGHGSTGKTSHVGGHGSITGITGGAEKLNEAQLMGWHVIQFTALHFSEAERLKHKLINPKARIEMAINERIQ